MDRNDSDADGSMHTQNFADFMWPGGIRPTLHLPYKNLLWFRPAVDPFVGTLSTDLCLAKINQDQLQLDDAYKTEEQLHKYPMDGQFTQQLRKVKDSADRPCSGHISAFKPVQKNNQSITNIGLLPDDPSPNTISFQSSESDHNEADVDVIGNEDDFKSDGIEKGRKESEASLQKVSHSEDLLQRPNSCTNMLSDIIPGKLLKDCAPGSAIEALDLRNGCNMTKGYKTSGSAILNVGERVEETRRQEITFREEIEKQLKFMYYARNCGQNIYIQRD